MTAALSALERVVRRTTDEFGLDAQIEFNFSAATYVVRLRRPETGETVETSFTSYDAEGRSDRFACVDGTVCRLVEELLGVKREFRRRWMPRRHHYM